MVVCFIFEQQQPGLFLPVRLDFDLDGAGVDLLGLVQFVELTLFFQRPDGDGGQVHQAHGLGAVQVAPDRHIMVVGLLQKRIFEFHAVDHGQESGVATVVAPVSVDHPDLGDGRVPALRQEILLAEGDIVGVHRQPVIPDERLQPDAVEPGEAVQRPDSRGDGVIDFEGIRQIQRSLPGFDGVDHILFDGVHVGVSEGSIQGVDLRAVDQRALALGDDLDALRGGIGALVKLAGQIFHREHPRALHVHFRRRNIQLRFGKNCPDRVIEQFAGHVFCVVPVQDAHILKAPNAQQRPGIGQERPGLVGQFLFLFNENSVDHYRFSLARSARAPMSLRQYALSK